jgi:hypothetical protein
VAEFPNLLAFHGKLDTPLCPFDCNCCKSLSSRDHTVVKT